MLGEFWAALYAFHTIYKQSGPNPAIKAGELQPHGRGSELEVEATTLFFFLRQKEFKVIPGGQDAARLFGAVGDLCAYESDDMQKSRKAQLIRV